MFCKHREPFFCLQFQ